MAAAEMRTAWQRTAATYYVLHEDVKRSSSKPEDHRQDLEAVKTKSQGKNDLSDGWNAVSTHFFMPDRKLDFHFHMENDVVESPSRKSLLDPKVGSEESDWQAIDSPSCADAKAVDKDWTLTEKTSVNCSVSSKSMATRNLEVMSQTVPRWRHANKGELAALIARKSSEDMGNCDLPPPLSPAAKGLLGPLTRDDVFHGGGEKSASPSPPSSAPSSAFRSFGPLDSKLKRKNVSPVELNSQAKRAIPTVAVASQAADDRSSESMIWKDMDSELLGEALCRSQTRAREAEKRAAAAVRERDQVLKLFFREASLSLTYKHWVRYLEAENTVLRRLEGEDDDQDEEEEELEKPLKIDEQRQKQQQQQLEDHHQKHRQRSSKDAIKSKRQRSSREHSVAVLGCTVGLAFALGVSLAGAGLVFGCTMGWILISF